MQGKQGLQYIRPFTMTKSEELEKEGSTMLMDAIHLQVILASSWIISFQTEAEFSCARCIDLKYLNGGSRSVISSLVEEEEMK